MKRQSGEKNELWLKAKCRRQTGPYLRPFAPNVNWRRAAVFVIGLNPAAPFRDEFGSFDHYWRALTRRPEQYQKVYRAKFRKSEAERSRTGKRIAELVSYLEPHEVLVTNVFAYPATDPRSIPPGIRREPFDEKILCRLITVCKPRVLFFHGREARKFAERYFGVSLNPYAAPGRQKVFVKLPDALAPSCLFAYHHLVGRVDPKHVMSERLKQFAEQMRLHLERSVPVRPS